MLMSISDSGKSTSVGDSFSNFADRDKFAYYCESFLQSGFRIYLSKVPATVHGIGVI